MVEFLSIKQNGYFYLNKTLDNSVCMIAKYYDKIQHSKEREIGFVTGITIQSLKSIRQL